MYSRYRRRPYRRYYAPRYRSVQMNDSETRTMSFTQNIDLPLTVGTGVQGISSQLGFGGILSGSPSTVSATSASGRVFYAGMMYDRFRVKSCSVQVRPKAMPVSTGVPNYTFYLAWDRYHFDISNAGLSSNPRIVTDDPSAKMIIWSPGGNASSISHYVYAVPSDRHQYVSIEHNLTPSWWTPEPSSAVFFPTLRYVIDLGNEQTAPLTVRLIFQFRFTLEFMGSASMGSGTDRGPLSAPTRLPPLAPRF